MRIHPKEQGGDCLIQALSPSKSSQPAWLAFFCALTTKQQPRLVFWRLMVPPECGEGLGGCHSAQPRQGLRVGTEEHCRTMGTQLERTGSSDLLPEPELCQVESICTGKGLPALDCA